MKAGYVAVSHDRFPPVEVSHMWLAGDAGPQSSQVAFDRGLPLREGRPRQVSGQLAVQFPRAAF